MKDMKNKKKCSPSTKRPRQSCSFGYRLRSSFPGLTVEECVTSNIYQPLN